MISIALVMLAFSWNNSIFAQKVSNDVAACYTSRQARYDCFMNRQLGSMERGKAALAKRLAIQAEQESKRGEKVDIHKARREQNRKEIMQQVEASRARNFSHKGEKYSLTFGSVIEPRN